MPRTRSDVPDLADFSSGVTHATVSPVGEPSDDDLALINLQARKPLTKEQVYVFRMEISNDLTDSYFTVMDPKTSLANYAEDFKEGRSLLNAHDSYALPVGRSFNGELATRGEKGNTNEPLRTAVITSTYIQRGLSLDSMRATNNDIIAGIDGGTVRDGSIRFGDGAYICSECGRDMYEDMFNWDDPDACMHWPGMSYGEGDDKHVATALIKDARASEHSLVFDGATPRAMIERATAAASRGKIAEQVVRRLESLYACRIVRPAASVRAKVPEPAEIAEQAQEDNAAENEYKAKAAAGQPPEQLAGPENDPERFLELVARDVKDAIEYLGVEQLAAVHDASATEGAPRWADMTAAERAEWSSSYISDLPDSAFAYIAPGGEKDADGKTTPRSLRYFPHHGDDGKPDEAHVKNALSRIPQASIPDSAKSSAEAHVKAHAKDLGIETENAAPPARTRRHQPIEGVIDLDPKVFADLMASPLSAEARQRFATALLDQVDDLDFSFVREVAAGFSASRAGVPLSAETASKVQNALDHMSTAADSHANAMEVLNDLLAAGIGAEPGPGSPDTNAGINDLNPAQADNAATAGAMTPSSTPESGIPENGVIGRGARSENLGEPGAVPLADKVKNGLAAIKAVLDDLLAEDDSEDADALDEAMGGSGADMDGHSPEMAGLGRIRGEAIERANIVRSVIKKEFRRPEMATVRAFFAQAEAGKRFRDTLERELLEWGVRARGVDFNRELHERLSPSYSVEDLETMVRDLERDAYQRFTNDNPGQVPDWAHSLAGSVGRQTVPTPVSKVYGPGNGTEPTKGDRSVDQFKHKAGRFSSPAQS